MAEDILKHVRENDKALGVAYKNNAFCKQISSDEALDALKEGNRNFRNPCRPPLEVDPESCSDPKLGQWPIAVVVCCSDSRVPPELVFWQGVGKLFVIRSAGNTLDAAAMGSLEYAVHKLNTPLVVVMGHEACGAVIAAHDAWLNGTDFDGSMSAFVEPILPAVIDAHLHDETDVADASIKANVSRIVKRLRHSSEPMLLSRIQCGTLRVVGARYNFDGVVDFFDEGPIGPRCPPAKASAVDEVA